jgi:hypothetical protein
MYEEEKGELVALSNKPQQQGAKTQPAEANTKNTLGKGVDKVLLT